MTVKQMLDQSEMQKTASQIMMKTGTCLLKASNILLYYFVSIKSLLSTTLLIIHSLCN